MRQCFSNPPITCEINYVVTRILSDKIEQNKIKRTRKEIQFITHSKGENYPIKYLFHTYVFVCLCVYWVIEQKFLQLITKSVKTYKVYPEKQHI